MRRWIGRRASARSAAGRRACFDRRMCEAKPMSEVGRRLLDLPWKEAGSGPVGCRQLLGLVRWISRGVVEGVPAPAHTAGALSAQRDSDQPRGQGQSAWVLLLAICATRGGCRADLPSACRRWSLRWRIARRHPRCSQSRPRLSARARNRRWLMHKPPVATQACAVVLSEADGWSGSRMQTPARPTFRSSRSSSNHPIPPKYKDGGRRRQMVYAANATAVRTTTAAVTTTRATIAATVAASSNRGWH